MASVLLVLNPTSLSYTYDLEARDLNSGEYTCAASENSDLFKLFNQIFNEGILPEKSLDFESIFSGDRGELADLIAQIEGELMTYGEDSVKHVEVVLEDGDDRNYIERNLREAFPELAFVFQEPILDAAEVSDFDRQLAKEIKYFEGMGITPDSHGLLEIKPLDDSGHTVESNAYVVKGLIKHFQNIYVKSEGQLYTSLSREAILATLADVLADKVSINEGFPSEVDTQSIESALSESLEALRKMVSDTPLPNSKISASTAAKLMTSKMSAEGATPDSFCQVTITGTDEILHSDFTSADVAAEIHKLYPKAVVVDGKDVYIESEQGQRRLETRLNTIRNDMGPDYSGTVSLVGTSTLGDIYLHALELAINLNFPNVTVKKDDKDTSISDSIDHILTSLRKRNVPKNDMFAISISEAISKSSHINPLKTVSTLVSNIHLVYPNAILLNGSTGYALNNNTAVEQTLRSAPYNLTDVVFTNSGDHTVH